MREFRTLARTSWEKKNPTTINDDKRRDGPGDRPSFRLLGAPPPDGRTAATVDEGIWDTNGQRCAFGANVQCVLPEVATDWQPIAAVAPDRDRLAFD